VEQFKPGATSGLNSANCRAAPHGYYADGELGRPAGINAAPPWLYGDVTTIEQASRLKAQDRCDRCGARAYFRAVMMSGELLFCAHHGRGVMNGLKSQALRVDDFTDDLVGLQER
jgi:hypothetical protein